jgi:hypothetical protein
VLLALVGAAATALWVWSSSGTAPSARVDADRTSVVPGSGPDAGPPARPRPSDGGRQSPAASGEPLAIAPDRGVATPSAFGSRPRPRDPWAAPLPAALARIRRRIQAGEKLSNAILKPVFAHALRNRDDPRPWLLMGQAYADLEWHSSAVDRYQKAFDLDPSSRGDPRMLEDLVRMTSSATAGRRARQALVTIYGSEALPGIERAIARAPDESERARLRELATEIGSDPRGR